MANWTDMGHAMRRRMGAPSNHLESEGKNMSKNIPTTEEILASAEHASSPRRYMGMDAAKLAPSAPSRGTKIAKKNTQSADPTAGGKANRSNVSAGNAAQSERLGARYTISAKFPAVHSSPWCLISARRCARTTHWNRFEPCRAANPPRPLYFSFDRRSLFSLEW